MTTFLALLSTAADFALTLNLKAANWPEIKKPPSERGLSFQREFRVNGSAHLGAVSIGFQI